MPNSIATGARPRTGTPSRIALCVARDRLHAVRAGRSPRARPTPRLSRRPQHRPARFYERVTAQ